MTRPIAIMLALQVTAVSASAQSSDPVGCYELRLGAWTAPVGSHAEPRNSPPERFRLMRGVGGDLLVSPSHSGREASASWKQLSPDSIYVLWKTTRWGGPAIRVRVHADSLTGTADIVSDFRPRVEPHAPVFARRVTCDGAASAEPERVRDAAALIRAAFAHTAARHGDQPRVVVEPGLTKTGHIGETVVVDVAAIDLAAIAREMGYGFRREADVVNCVAVANVGRCTMNGVDLLLSAGIGRLTLEDGRVWIGEKWFDARGELRSRICEYHGRKVAGEWKTTVIDGTGCRIQ
jgi:hypothetical protein